MKLMTEAEYQDMAQRAVSPDAKPRDFICGYCFALQGQPCESLVTGKPTRYHTVRRLGA